MNPIPFVHRLTPDDERLWLDTFRRAMPDMPVAPLAALGPDARAQADVAIVANPDPADLAGLTGLRYAVLDVFATEPLPPTDPLWRHRHVTVLPHISAPTSRDTASAIVASNLRAWRNDGVLPATVQRARGY